MADNNADYFIIDLTDFKDTQGALVPEGRYRVQITDAEQRDSQSSEFPYITLYLKIVGGEYDGQTILDRLSLSPKAAFRVVNFMRAIGLPTPNKKLKIAKRTWIGRVLEVDVEDDTYNGTTRSSVTGYLEAKKTESGAAEDLDGLGEFESDTSSNPSTNGTKADEKADDKAEDEGADSVTQGDDEDADIDLEELSL